MNETVKIDFSKKYRKESINTRWFNNNILCSSLIENKDGETIENHTTILMDS